MGDGTGSSTAVYANLLGDDERPCASDASRINAPTVARGRYPNKGGKGRQHVHPEPLGPGGNNRQPGFWKFLKNHRRLLAEGASSTTPAGQGQAPTTDEAPIACGNQTRCNGIPRPGCLFENHRSDRCGGSDTDQRADLGQAGRAAGARAGRARCATGLRASTATVLPSLNCALIKSRNRNGQTRRRQKLPLLCEPCLKIDDLNCRWGDASVELVLGPSDVSVIRPLSGMQRRRVAPE